MDLHNFTGGITLEDVVKSHMADLKVQDKYGVRYIKFYVNQDSGLVFCLMEGPDEETCEAVHREAHGNIACNIIKVEPGDFEVVMQEGMVNHVDMALHNNGDIDIGLRFFLTFHLDVPLLDANNESVDKAYKAVRKLINKHGGKEIENENESILAVFTACLNALKCAQKIEAKLKETKDKDFRIGISSGNPVIENKNNFFQSSIKLSNRLCEISKPKQILITSEVKNICVEKKIESKLDNTSSIKALSLPDQEFLNELMETVDLELDDHELNVDTLGKDLGVSRTQLYRKIIKITGKSPNDLIKEIRLKRSLNLLRKGFGNVAQIAFETGFNNPSYFSQCFKEHYGITPSQYLKELY